MQEATNQPKATLIITIFFLLFTISSISWAENKIVFLQFQINSNTVTLTNSTLAEGQLKKSRSNISGKEIYFDVVSKDSKLLSSGELENPLIRKFEYENPDKPGELLNKIIYLESAEFSVRINYNDQIDKINFYHAQYDKDLDNTRNSENLIGSVSLTSINGNGGENE